MAGRKRIPEDERFLSHVKKLPDDGCWLWTAYKMPNGYGNFRTPVRHELAHRAAYRIFCGTLFPGLDVMHTCDTPSCVKPAHLRLGTRKQNMQDAKNKGRNARGEGHGRSKLLPGHVVFALESKLRQWEIALALGVSQSHISAIKARKKWAHFVENCHR
jgi:predicted XRE-type DNA-binding protein